MLFRSRIYKVPVQNFKWKDSVVRTRKYSRESGIVLTRLDNREFTVFESSGFLLNLALLDSGLELIHIVRIVRERGKFKAIYFRVLRTELAIEESEEDDWNTSETTRDGGLRRTSHLGKKQLRRLLALEHAGDAKFKNRIFHWGDVEYKTDVEYIVGVAG